MALLTGPMLSGNQFQELLQHLTTNLKQVNTPTLTKEDKKLRALCAHALWQDATYLVHDGKWYDILNKFTLIKEQIIKQEAVARWTAEALRIVLRENSWESCDRIHYG